MAASGIYVIAGFLLAKTEYDALLETLHLIRSPRNAARLREVIAGIDTLSANMPETPATFGITVGRWR